MYSKVPPPKQNMFQSAIPPSAAVPLLKILKIIILGGVLQATPFGSKSKHLDLNLFNQPFFLLFMKDGFWWQPAQKGYMHVLIHILIRFTRPASYYAVRRRVSAWPIHRNASADKRIQLRQSIRI